MADETVLLRGGSRDGETTERDTSVTRLLANSDAPGLFDVYEITDERQGDAVVFEFVGQEPAGDAAPELQHFQSTGHADDRPSSLPE